MSELFQRKPKVVETVFTPDGQVMPDGAVRYKVLGGNDPSGVYWVKTVPAGASIEEIMAVQAERNAKRAELAALAGV